MSPLLLWGACGWLRSAALSQEERLLRAWADEPEQVPALLQEIRDPEERTTLVGRLLDADPTAAALLCPSLPVGAARVRCEQIAVDPALAAATPDGDVPRASDRGAPGPSGRDVLPLGGITACPEGQRCTVEAALALVQAQGIDGYAQGVALCLGIPHPAEAAGCLPQLLAPLVVDTPPATQPDRQAWQPLRQHARQLRELWEARDADYGRLVLDRLWAEAMGRAYGQVDEVVGNPLEITPPLAVVHVRSAAALRLLQLSPAVSEDRVQGWVERLQGALRGRTQVPGPPSAVPLRVLGRSLWPADRPGEATIPAAARPGGGRRAISAEEDIDAALAVLEAAARVSPPRLAVLRDGVEHPSPLVQWAAKRLQGGLATPTGEATR